MFYLRVLSVLMCVLLISGCAQMSLGKGFNAVGETLTGKRVERAEDAMASWVGKDIDSLVSTWGPPSSTYTNRDGSIIYDYSSSTTTTREAQYSIYGHLLAPGESNTSTCKKAFLVAPNGIISKWRVETPRSCEYTGNKISKDVPIPVSTF